MIWDWDYTLEILPLLAQAAVVTIEATILGFAARRDPRPRCSPILRISRPGWVALPICGLRRVHPLDAAADPDLLHLLRLPGVRHRPRRLDRRRAGASASTTPPTAPRSIAPASPTSRAASGKPRPRSTSAAWTTFRDVIIPQAIPPVVPALGNYLVALFKETPLLSAIAVLELMQTAKILGSETFRYTEPITLVGVFFLVFSLVSAAGSARSNAACQRGGRHAPMSRPPGRWSASTRSPSATAR